MDLLLMMYEFFKTGLFAVGGGLATVPFLQKMSENYPHWFTSAELADMIAVAESTPGPIGINMATYAGYRCAGVPGATVVTSVSGATVVTVSDTVVSVMTSSPFAQAASEDTNIAAVIATASKRVVSCFLFIKSSFQG